MPIPAVYPLIKQIWHPLELARGKWADNGPFGITVHYTATRNLRAVLDEQGVGYHLVIDRDGSRYQRTFLDQRVDHAGSAVWNKRSPNRAHVAVAVMSHGWLKETPSGNFFTSDGKTQIHSSDVRHGYGNVGDEILPWDAATKLQEATLIETLRYLMTAGSIKAEDICGHDECALPKGRKVDPGGVLSLEMAELREKLKGPQA